MKIENVGSKGSLWECEVVNTKKKEQYIFKASKGWKRVIFKPEDCVWLHMQKWDFLNIEILIDAKRKWIIPNPWEN